MASRNPGLRRALQRAIYSTVTVPVMFGAPGALAQEGEELEEVIVTGSRIARDPNLGAAVPVQSIGAEDIQLSGQTDLGEVLNDLPALLSSTSSVNSGTGIFGSGSGETAGAAEVGETILQLRGLGIERTLVLVNGRRHVAGVGGSQAVDIGSIPSQLIERVEVLTGGASAIYGADAVTGVVNFIMKDNFEGLSIDVQGGVADRGDGENFSVNALYGLNFAGDRGNIAIGVNFTDRAGLKFGDRDWARNNGVASDDANPARRFQRGDIDAATTPNFAQYYSPANSRTPRGFSIPSEQDFIDDFQASFPGQVPTLTSAEQALIQRAANAPTRAILPGHNFALTSGFGVLNVGDLNAPNIDIDNNGLQDCLQSWEGYNATYSFAESFGFIGGCWIIDPDGTVRPHNDGLIADLDNQFGPDGGPDAYDQDDLTPEDQKFSLNVLGHYDVSDDVTFFWEGKWSRQENEYQGIVNSFWDLLTIAPDNPFISQLPPDLAAVGQSVGLFITRDPIDLGPNIDKGTRDTVRFVTGLSGEIDNGWEWEVSANYGRFDLEFEDRNRPIVDRWLAAIDAVDDGNGNPICRSDVDPTPPPSTPFDIPLFDPGFFTFNPGDGTCVPANILGGAAGVSQQAVDFITDTVVNRFQTEQFVLAATLVGEWGETDAGPIGFAVGAELRTERSRSVFDPLVRGVLPVTTDFGDEGQTLGEVFANEAEPRQGSLVFDSGATTRNVADSYDVGDIFGEISVPILAGRNFAEELTFDAAVRFSNYSTVGNTLTWKAGGSWAPVESLRFRGAYSVAVRAPNIDELFSPRQSAFFRPDDPCEQTEIDALIAVGDPRGAVRQGNCAAAGIPAGFVDPLTARFVGATAGNADLIEEEAETITVGFVYQPEWLSGLSFTVDYWDVVIDDAISAPSDQDIVDNCYDSSEFPNNQFCSLLRRNDDPTSPQFNGLVFLEQQQLNIGSLEATGVDFAARYDFGFDAFDLSTTISGTYMDKLDEFFDPGDPTAVDPELGELQRPELAATIDINLGRDNWSVNWQTQYLDEQTFRDVEIETVSEQYGPDGIADETYIHNLSFAWDINDTYRLYGGVNNVGDEDPFRTEQAYPVSPIGRFFFVGFNVNIGQ